MKKPKRRHIRKTGRSYRAIERDNQEELNASALGAIRRLARPSIDDLWAAAIKETQANKRRLKRQMGHVGRPS